MDLDEERRRAVPRLVNETFPGGPWLLVVGMHRSGTSAITGALGRLGYRMPAAGDLVSGRFDNPVHYESEALTNVDDRILARLGGTWAAPPALAPAWERAPELVDLVAQAGAAARTAFPGDGPVAWKDPRLCLLLPFWLSQLPAPVTTLFVWRAPEAVARSLTAREELTWSHGLALWDRYNRAALEALAGRRTFVVRYEALVADPVASMHEITGWLAEDDRSPARGVGADRIATAAATIVDPHRAPTGAVADGAGAPVGGLPEVCRHTVEALSELGGRQEPLPSLALPEPPQWMADAIEQRRAYDRVYSRYLRYARWTRRVPGASGLVRLLGRAR